jgi:hypothetical protein
MNDRFRKIITWVCLFYVLLILPILFLSHFGLWYDYNFHEDNTDNLVGREILDNAKDNLIGFFYYQENLNDLWTLKEKAHFKEVRFLFFESALILLFAIIILALNRKILVDNIKNFTIFNIVLVIFLASFLIFFFDFFWREVFHKILFDNNFWLMEINDMSYHIFKIDFFSRTFLAIVSLFIIENLLLVQLLYVFKKKNKKSLYKNKNKY